MLSTALLSLTIDISLAKRTNEKEDSVLKKVKTKVTKVKKNKKLMPKSHVKTVRYLSTNKKVATVSASGKITAKGKGNCTVIAFAHNGISKSIKVTVKRSSDNSNL